LCCHLNSLSAPIYSYGYIFAIISSPTRTLGVEWIRSLISFFDPDGIRRKDSIGQAGSTGLMGFFFACGEILFGHRPLYPGDPVNPV